MSLFVVFTLEHAYRLGFVHSTMSARMRRIETPPPAADLYFIYSTQREIPCGRPGNAIVALLPPTCANMWYLSLSLSWLQAHVPRSYLVSLQKLIILLTMTTPEGRHVSPRYLAALSLPKQEHSSIHPPQTHANNRSC